MQGCPIFETGLGLEGCGLGLGLCLKGCGLVNIPVQYVIQTLLGGADPLISDNIPLI